MWCASYVDVCCISLVQYQGDSQGLYNTVVSQYDHSEVENDLKWVRKQPSLLEYHLENRIYSKSIRSVAYLCSQRAITPESARGLSMLSIRHKGMMERNEAPIQITEIDFRLLRSTLTPAVLLLLILSVSAVTL